MGGGEGGDACQVGRGQPRAQQVLGRRRRCADEPVVGGGCGPGRVGSGRWGCRAEGPPEQPLVRSRGRAGRPARSALRRGLPPGEAGRRRLGRRERRRVALAETEERAREAWARGQTARSFRSSLLQRAGSSEAFRARDEYRPTAIVICSWLNIFYLKRRWGCMGGGV